MPTRHRSGPQGSQLWKPMIERGGVYRGNQRVDVVVLGQILRMLDSDVGQERFSKADIRDCPNPNQMINMFTISAVAGRSPLSNGV